MRYYIEYLCENESAYRRAFFFSVLFFLIATGLTILSIRERPLQRVTGEVQSIEKSQVSRKNNTTFDLKQHYHFEDVIAIRIAGIPYFVETYFQSRWDEVLDKVHVGDIIFIDYLATDEGLRVFQLKKESSIILDPKEIEQSMFKFKVVFAVLSIASLSYILILFFKRRSYVKKNQHIL